VERGAYRVSHVVCPKARLSFRGAFVILGKLESGGRAKCQHVHKVGLPAVRSSRVLPVLINLPTQLNSSAAATSCRNVKLWTSAVATHHLSDDTFGREKHMMRFARCGILRA
jgi:hypothetical protein